MFDNWATQESLLAFPWVTLFVRLVVEYTKSGVDRLTRKTLPTFYYALLLSWIMLFAASLVFGELNAQSVLLNVINGFTVTIVAKTMAVQEKR